MTLALRYAAFSHLGLLRTGNEDSGYAGPRLLAVADGMGGHAAGEVASAVAIASVAALDEDAPGADLIRALKDAATAANDHLREMVEADASLDGMGTTLTALLFSGRRVGMLHIGDSRCYLLRDDELSQITRDDTLVQSLVDDKKITEDEARTHPQRSLITRALDGRDEITFDLRVREAKAGDRYLLCSDGLTGPVRTDNVREALELRDLTASVERLVDLALRGGGPDNITVVVADVIDTAQEDPTGQPVVAGAAREHPQVVPETMTGGAAGRAAAAKPRPTEPEPEPAAVPVERRAGKGRRVGALGLASLVLLGALGVGGFLFVNDHWYVGVDGGRVTVFRGLSGSIAGITLARVDTGTDIPAGRLSDLRQDRLAAGLDARDRDDAQRIVAVLREEADRPTPPPTTTVTVPGPDGSPAPTLSPSTSPFPPGPGQTVTPAASPT